MKQMKQALSGSEASHPKSATIKTTLYELIDAISKEVPSGEDKVVTEIFLHLLDTGRVKFIGNMRNFDVSRI